MTHRNGGGIVRAEKFTGRRKGRCATRICVGYGKVCRENRQVIVDNLLQGRE